MIVAYVVLGLLGLLSVFLLTGRGGFLIAGYNTSSPEEKAKYDAKKLCRTVGVMMLLLTLALAGLLLIPYGSPFASAYMIFFFIFLIADIGGCMAYANTRCQKKDYKAKGENGVIDDEYLKKAPAEKKKKNTVAIIAVCVVALPVMLLVGITLYQSNQPPVFTVSGGTLQISSAYGENVSLSDIKSMELKDSLPKDLSKISGSDFGSILKGKFRADGKEAEVYMDASKPPYLYIETSDGLVILNDATKAKTESLYNKIKAAGTSIK